MSNSNRKLTKTEETKLMIIENFIDYIEHIEGERKELLKDAAYQYVLEDHVDEISQAFNINQ